MMEGYCCYFCDGFIQSSFMFSHHWLEVGMAYWSRNGVFNLGFPYNGDASE